MNSTCTAHNACKNRFPLNLIIDKQQRMFLFYTVSAHYINAPPGSIKSHCLIELTTALKHTIMFYYLCLTKARLQSEEDINQTVHLVGSGNKTQQDHHTHK